MKKLLMVSLVVLGLFMAGCKDESMKDGAAVVEVRGCEDSDGGINKDVQGVVTVGDEDYSDDCVAGLLIEYYCEDGKEANQNIRCANKCGNGKCV